MRELRLVAGTSGEWVALAAFGSATNDADVDSVLDVARGVGAGAVALRTEL